MAKAARGKKKGAAKAKAKKVRCAAKTQAGTRCKNSAAPRSKFCATHKGWKPPKAKPKARAKPKAKPKARARKKK
jgi:hypothetical protein